ncbi:hypothetical protein [Mycolicibacterium llatzerense]|uniref:hypothetical protein n=1 Tax=Mycolicibacterium llatzerense TaxID=280871 RepID=UPI0008DD91A8|nr:hypothetical protein [Mycolicibacterium llatzerense]
MEPGIAATHVGIDLSGLERPLLRYRRGMYNHQDLLDAVAAVRLLPAPYGSHADTVTTVAALWERLLANSTVQEAGYDAAGQELLVAEVVVVLVRNARAIVRGGWQWPPNPEVTADVVRDFSAHWSAELAAFIESAPPRVRVRCVRFAVGHGLADLASTEALLESASESTDSELDYREEAGAAVVRRLIGDGKTDLAVEFALTFGPRPHRLLLEAAQVLPAAPDPWLVVMALLDDHRDAVLADDEVVSDTALYAAANAARAGQFDAARALLSLTPLDAAPPQRLTADTDGLATRRQLTCTIERLAAGAVIYQALGQTEDAVRWAVEAAALTSELAAHSPHDHPYGWKLPKAAGWLLAADESDPAARVMLLKLASNNYELRGALDSRLALQTATAYLELGQPALAAYFLANARGFANLPVISDRFLDPVRWERLGDLLELARVTEAEFHDAAAELERLGYLPEPETGDHFRSIDWRWSHDLISDSPTLVEPPPRRC